MTWFARLTDLPSYIVVRVIEVKNSARDVCTYVRKQEILRMHSGSSESSHLKEKGDTSVYNVVDTIL